MHSKIARNYFYNLSYQILSLFVPLLTTPYISRVLGAEAIGTYSYTFSIVGYFSTIAALGIGTYGQLKIAENRDNKIMISEIFFELIITRFTTTLICSIFYFFFIFLFGGINKGLYIILSLNIISAAFDISWLLQGLEEFKKTVFRNYVIKLTSIILTFIFIKKSKDLYLYAFISQGAILLGNLTLWIGLKNYIVKDFKLKIHFKENIKQSFIYFIPAIAITLYSYLDKTMIGAITGSSIQNGYYEQAFKIQQIAMTIVTSLSTVIMPRMTYMFKKNDTEGIKDILNKSYSITTMFCIPLTLGLIAISEQLIPWFLGKAFLPSIKILKVLSILILINGLVEFYGKQIIIPSGMQKQYNIITIVGVICNAILNFIFISYFGAMGACYASVLSALVIMVLLTINSKKIFEIKSIITIPIKYLIAGIIMFCCVSNFKLVELSNIVLIICKILIGILVYTITLIIMKEKLIWEILDKFVLSKRKK